MKNKAVRVMLSLSITAMLGCVMPCTAAAVQEEGLGTAAGEERVSEDVSLSLITGEVVLKNETSRFFCDAEYKKAESRVMENAQVTNQGAEQLAQTWDLVLSEENGVIHTFPDVRADKWKEPKIIEQLGMLYVEFLDEENQKQDASEETEERNLEASVIVYATTEVNVREKPDIASQSLKVTKAGEEWRAVAVLPGWVKVEGNGITGYVHHEYMTENKGTVG